MRNILKGVFLFFTSILFSQQTIVSGSYDFGLKLNYNNKTKKLTGYFEDYTGENQKFSCVFYLEGTVTGNQFKVKTYYPNDPSEDLIEGTVEIVNSKHITLKLPEEHGGCWNVQHFADEPVDFELSSEKKWIQIGYIATNKSYFFKEKNKTKKLKSYLVKNDFICIEKIENGWAYCTYFGDKITKGWILLKDINQL